MNDDLPGYPRIEFVPVVGDEGAYDPYVCSADQGVELDAGWVHVVEYDATGSRRVLRSYPAHRVSVVVHRG